MLFAMAGAQYAPLPVVASVRVGSAIATVWLCPALSRATSKTTRVRTPSAAGARCTRRPGPAGEWPTTLVHGGGVIGQILAVLCCSQDVLAAGAADRRVHNHPQVGAIGQHPYHRQGVSGTSTSNPPIETSRHPRRNEPPPGAQRHQVRLGPHRALGSSRSAPPSTSGYRTMTTGE